MRRHDSTDAGFILLKWSVGSEPAKETRFFKAVSIGRGVDNNIDLGDERVSRHHAVIWAEDGGWHVRDLDSANGTFLNHAPVTGSAALAAVLRIEVSPEWSDAGRPTSISPSRR